MAQERLSEELRDKLCSFIRAGTTRLTAALACGLSIDQLREVCDADIRHRKQP